MHAHQDLQRSIHGVLLPGFNGLTPPPWLWTAASHGLAGVLLFGENTPSPERTAELTAQLHHRAPQLLISSRKTRSLSVKGLSALVTNSTRSALGMNLSVSSW